MDKDELYQKMLAKVIVFLAYKPRTRKEISLRLDRYLKSQKALTADTKTEVVDSIFDYLAQNKLIDDEEFIRLFVESKTRGKSVLGKRVIQNKLIAKGISKENAAAFVDGEISEEDELISATNALIGKFKSVDFHDFAKNVSRETHDKMGRFLLSRGFSYSTAKQAVDYLLKRP